MWDTQITPLLVLHRRQTHHDSPCSPPSHSDTGEGEEEFRTPHGSPPCVFSDEEAGDGMRVRLNSDGSMVIVSALSSPFEGNDRDLDVGGHAKGPLVTTGSDTRFTSHSKDSPVEDRHLLSDVRDDGQPSPAVDVTQPPLAVDSVDKLSSSMDDVCQLPPSVNGVAKPASSNDAIIDGYKGNGSSEQEGATDPHALSSSVDKAEVDRSHSSVEHPQVEINPLVPTLVESAVDSLTAPVTAHSEQYTKGFGGCVHRGPMRLVINDDSSNSLSESEFTTPAEGRFDIWCVWCLSGVLWWGSVSVVVGSVVCCVWVVSVCCSG